MDRRCIWIELRPQADRLLQEYADRTGKKKIFVMSRLVEKFVRLPADLQLLFLEEISEANQGVVAKRLLRLIAAAPANKRR